MSFSCRSIVNTHATLKVNSAPRSTVANEAPRQDEDILAPLIFFYGIGSVRPRVTFVEPENLAEQERALLVHDTDMTPRLRDFHACEIDLDVAARARIGNYLVRASVLHRRKDGKPVEFGAIGIHLDALPEEAQKLTLEGLVPFGAILERVQVPHSSHPRGYFRISVDSRLAELLGATAGQVLYGRCNELRTGHGRVLADVVEVLPRMDGSLSNS
jgi:chorismate-pyruvate lyase